jgi:hypothetical protein
MNLPDPERLGGLGWTRRTGGALTSRERRSLLAAIALGQWESVLGRAKLLIGKLPPGAARVDLDTFSIPDSEFARQVESACNEQPQELVSHSYRTWLFGRALAVVDGAALDAELFYCGALLHDYGLMQPTPGRDFTLAGADRALACAASVGVDERQATEVADAICVHATPGVSVDRDGPLGCYLQWGAMADVAGLRLCDVARTNVDEIVRRHPRDGFKRQIISMMRAEATAVPQGRFGVLIRAGVPLAVRMAPFPS